MAKCPDVNAIDLQEYDRHIYEDVQLFFPSPSDPKEREDWAKDDWNDSWFLPNEVDEIYK